MKADVGLWLLIGAFTLALTWLLTNHHPPYLSFHSDAWVALIFILIAAGVAFFGPKEVRWHYVQAVSLALALVPLVQVAIGIQFFVGTAWVSILYVLGFALAVQLGARSEQLDSDWLIDLLFLGIGIASIASVGVQFYQWLGYTNTDGIADIWVLHLIGSRPYGNIGQPNQLASLLLWGILAGGWGIQRGAIRLRVGILYWAFLLFGLALTQSRMAWLAVAMLTAATWYWRALWPSKRVPLWTSLGALFFLLATLSIEPLSRLMVTAASPDLGARVTANFPIRPAVWAMYLESMLDRPWLGYGWGQLLTAQVNMLVDHPVVHGLLHSHSHNLFLDLIIWNGFPIGLLVSGLLLFWVFRSVRSVAQSGDAILLMAILAIGLHAMLELPLHYAYFLLPTGVFVGVLNERLGFRVAFQTSRWVLVVLLCASTVMFGLVVRDYFRIESAYFDLRFELNRVGTNHPTEPPDVLLLTQLREQIRYARFEPHERMTDEQVEWARNITSLYPNTAGLLKLVKVLVLNDRRDEAAIWLRRICPIVSASQCIAAEYAWKQAQEEDARLAILPWPKGCLRGQCRGLENASSVGEG